MSEGAGPPPPLRAVFVAFDGLTQLDLTGPWQVIERIPNVRCTLAASTGDPVRAHCGLRLVPDEILADTPSADILLVPGGPGVDDLLLDPDMLAHIRRLAAGARFITSVCTGSLLLGAAGLLRGRRAACHWASRDLLAEFGAIPDSSRVVRDGPFITGGGVTAGIDFALSLAADLVGEGVARLIQTSIEYAPEPPFQAGTPEIDPEGAKRIRLLGASRRAALEEKVRLAAGLLSADQRS